MPTADAKSISKKTTGIGGFDQITEGGLPEGRLTAIIGGPGTGKSIFALQTLLHRFRTAGEAGLFVTFEEPPERIRSNVAGFDWKFGEVPEDQLALVDARLPADAVQAGAFDLSGLLAALSARKAETGAKNVVFDGVDLLISNLNDEYLERRELARLDDWIRAESMSAIITVKAYTASEQDQKRADLIQYITDCVILLEGRLFQTSFSRTLRVIKYRGTAFNASAVPVVIGTSGFGVIPARASRGSYPVYSDRVPTGIPRLDAILGGGFIRGSSVLVTGAPGTAKTSLAASLVADVCRQGGRALFVSFDESDARIIMNMKSIGIDLAQHVATGNLSMLSLHSNGHSPEESFLKIWDVVRTHKPDTIVVDPLSAFTGSDYPFAEDICENLIEFSNSTGITFLGTSLLGQAGGGIELSASHVSTIADTWLHVSYLVQNGERNRTLTIVKSRGTAHSNQVRELELTTEGINLLDVYASTGGVLVGSARMERQQEDARIQKLDQIKHRRRKFELERNINELKERAQALSYELASKQQEIELEESTEDVRMESRHNDIAQRMAMRRTEDDLAVPEEPRRNRNTPERRR